MNIGIGEKFKMNGKTWRIVDIREGKYICQNNGDGKIELTKEQIKIHFN